MTAPKPAKVREFIIKGITHAGKGFRPSDWSERLCGVMSSFRPQGSGGPHAHLHYSPYVRPIVFDGVKSVVVDERLHDIEPRAWDFVRDFAKDNDLVTIEACLLPDPGMTKP